MSMAVESAAPSFVDQMTAELEEDRLELPGFPEAVLRIQRTLQYPDATVDDVVKILASDPALAAEALRIANSVVFRRNDRDITDLRTAVNRMGFSLIRSISVAFAIRQLRLRETYSPAARAEVESIWRDSVATASICFVVARRCTKLSADQALLTGLLHVLGRLYIVMRTEASDDTVDPDALAAASASHAALGAAILKAWGLSEHLQHAVEHQDDVDYQGDDVSVTDVLIIAKLLAVSDAPYLPDCPALTRIAAAKEKNPIDVVVEHADEIRALRSSLGA